MVFLHLAHNRLESIVDQIKGLVNLKIVIMEGNSIHKHIQRVYGSLGLPNVDL